MLAALAPGEPRDGLTDPDDVPEPPDEPVTKLGDLWLLGDHRLLCGDAGSETDLDRLLDGATVDLLLTDPPYNVKVEPRSNDAIAAGMAASYDASYQAAVTAYTTYYNYHRLHGALSWLTPAERFDGTPFIDRGFEHVPSLAPVADLLAELLVA